MVLSEFLWPMGSVCTLQARLRATQRKYLAAAHDQIWGMIDQFKVFVFTIVFVFVILVSFVYIRICTCISYSSFHLVFFLYLYRVFFYCSALKMTSASPFRKSQNCTSQKTTKKEKKFKYQNCSSPKK